MVDTEAYLTLSVILFTIGTVGVMIRRNAIVVFMCIELMLNAGNLALITFARQNGDMAGQIYVMIVMAVAATEVAVGLAIIISVFRHNKTVNLDEITELHG